MLRDHGAALLPTDIRSYTSQKVKYSMHGQLYKVSLMLSIEFRRARIGVRGGFIFFSPFLSRVRIKGEQSRHTVCHFSR